MSALSIPERDGEERKPDETILRGFHCPNRGEPKNVPTNNKDEEQKHHRREGEPRYLARQPVKDLQEPSHLPLGGMLRKNQRRRYRRPRPDPTGKWPHQPKAVTLLRYRCAQVSH